jgi:hypothetical protein
VTPHPHSSSPTLPAENDISSYALLVSCRLAENSRIIERDYQELKQELGLGHFEGRNWRGFHHHATLCIAAYGFLVAERSRFSPSARVGKLAFTSCEPTPDFRPRGSPNSSRAA